MREGRHTDGPPVHDRDWRQIKLTGAGERRTLEKDLALSLFSWVCYIWLKPIDRPWFISQRVDQDWVYVRYAWGMDGVLMWYGWD